MDFYDYWDQEKQSKSILYSHCTCINTTFYLTDNTSETGRLRFLKDFNNKIKKEIVRQNESIVLIASENYASKSVRIAQGSIFTNK